MLITFVHTAKSRAAAILMQPQVLVYILIATQGHTFTDQLIWNQNTA